MKYSVAPHCFLHAIIALLSFSSFVGAATFRGLGDLPGGSFSSVATAVSADGKTVAGYSAGTNGYEAVRWTGPTGLTGLGDLPGGTFASFANGISADGTTIVGNSQSTDGDQAFRWTEATGMIGLGDLPGSSFFSFAAGVSSNGNVVVGHSASALSGTRYEAFRWTPATDMAGLGDLPGGVFNSRAWGVSADGLVVVGESSSANSGNNNLEAFRWTSSGMIGLGDLPGGPFHSIAYAISADGSMIAGYSIPSSGDHAAFRWTAGTGMLGLGALPCDTFSIARAASADGSIIVGDPQTSSGDCVFVWDAQRGIRRLSEVMATDYGLTLTGWTLRRATAVSQNGHVIVGYGINPSGQTEGWIADFTPSLEIIRGTNHVLLQWPTNPPSFTLQKTPALSPGTWTSVFPAASVISNSYVVTNTISGDANFFRLASP